MQKPKLKKLADSIYCLEFKNAYDLSMTFLRCQEYYESPKFREQFFTLSDFMEWYAKENGNGAFTYPVDYVGFNLPSRVIWNVMSKLRLEKYDVWTPYDQLMWDIALEIVTAMHKEKKASDAPFYLIGVTKKKNDKQTLEHEVAHALFTVNSQYQRMMGELINKLSKKDWKTMTDKLKGRGYADNVFDDEAQAYLATGLHDTMKLAGLKKAAKPFQKAFKPYKDKIL